MLFTDGYQTLISFSENPSVTLAEIEVTPPGVNGGGAISTTTMRNVAVRTNHPKALLDVTPIQATVAYEVATLNEMLLMTNVNQEITVTYPDGGTGVIWGYVNHFTPGSHQEGERPTATLEVLPTNMDNAGVEQIPVFTPGP
jgi:hypothetical protein